MSSQPKIIRPDAKGRVTLGKLAVGVSGFAVGVDEHNRIILDPYVEVPARENLLATEKNILPKRNPADTKSGQVRYIYNSNDIDESID